MSKKIHILVSIAAGLLALNGLACIQTMWMAQPHVSSQLPADLFKVHIHLRPEPITVEIPLIGGKVVSSVTRTPDDPKAEYQQMISKYESDPPAHNTFEERNDYAAALLFAGRYPDAITVLLRLEQDFQKKYSTASNLGTAYELIDDLTNASVWIREGMKRNPDSHEGTEWLHLAILNAKRELKRDKTWLVTHSVLDDRGNRTNAEIEQALEYQLNERLYFVRSDDPVMCDLFYQAAIITTDPAKKSYYLRQVPRFGDIRDYQVARLNKR